jgi:1,4-alpha-glucan branching enzyme
MTIFLKHCTRLVPNELSLFGYFFTASQDSYVIGFPAAGTWKLRFNSDWQDYSEIFAGYRSTDVLAEPGEYDGFPFRGALYIGPYSVLIFSQ